MSQLNFKNNDGELMIEGSNDEVTITCQTRGSYDYGVYDLTESEVERVIKFLQKWKSSKK